MERKNKYEKLWAHANNLCSAYDNLRQMKELFESAKFTERDIHLMESQKETLSKELESLNKAKELLNERCKEDAIKVRKRLDEGEADLIKMKEKYIQRYESEYGKQVHRAEADLESLETKSMKLKESIESQLSRSMKLDKELDMKEGQIKTFQEQFEEIHKVLT